MGLIQWAQSPWGERVPIHIGFWLLWVSAIGGLLFLVGHAIYVRYWTKPAHAPAGGAAVGSANSTAGAPAIRTAGIPERVKRHSFGARMFHWIMSVAMFALLLTAFLPRLGVKFAWVTYHWIAGVVLTVSVIYHIFHAIFWLDFWSIWPNKEDVEDASKRMRRALGQDAPAPRKFGKYPLENKMYHLAVLFAGLSVIGTGVFMMNRIQTPFFTRNPYLFGDTTWGWMYVLHGLAGIGFVMLIMIHVYFALRPEKLFITKSMITGTMSRENYLEHYDPERWPADGSPTETGTPASKEVPA
jgi:cytochrome b subunit of formate dehydrogenase